MLEVRLLHFRTAPDERRRSHRAPALGDRLRRLQSAAALRRRRARASSPHKPPGPRHEVAEYGAGKRLIPFNHARETPIRAAFDKALLGLKPSEAGRFWVDRRMRDQPLPPRIVPTSELALRVVATLPEAISYVYQNPVHANVRVLTIDGEAPGQPGYLLP